MRTIGCKPKRRKCTKRNCVWRKCVSSWTATASAMTSQAFFCHSLLFVLRLWHFYGAVSFLARTRTRAHAHAHTHKHTIPRLYRELTDRERAVEKRELVLEGEKQEILKMVWRSLGVCGMVF